jgi:hypothetical protein
MAAAAALALLALLALLARAAAAGAPAAAPFGLRLTFGDAPRELTLTWSTGAPVAAPPCVELVQLAPGDGSALRCGASRPFVEPREAAPRQWVHSASLGALPPGSRWRYRAGAASGAWSRWHSLAAPPSANDTAAPARLLLVGDLGVTNARTRPFLIEDAESGAFHAVHHVGDLAYDLADARGRRARQFLAAMAPVSAALPFQASPGNHEAGAAAGGNFSHARALWRMPRHAEFENLYYSYDVGPLLHVVSLNSEAFFWPALLDPAGAARMLHWLEADLAAAAAARAAGAGTSWIVVISHRPFYCSYGLEAEEAAGGGLEEGGTAASAAGAAAGPRRCAWENEAARRGARSVCPRDNPRACRPAPGAPARPAPALEALLAARGVDLVVAGHTHSYMRTFPILDYRIAGQPARDRREGGAAPDSNPSSPGFAPDVFLDPQAPVHVITGAGGNREMRGAGAGAPPARGRCATAAAPWCAFAAGPARGGGAHDFSYSQLAALNATHLRWRQVAAEGGGRRLIDEFWLARSAPPWLLSRGAAAPPTPSSRAHVLSTKFSIVPF